MKQTLNYNFKRITASLSAFAEWFPLSLQRALLPYCLIALFFGLFIAGCGDKPSKANEPIKKNTQSLAVRTLKAEQRTFERRLTVQGNIEAKQIANVASRLAGNIDAIYVDEGDRVEANKTVLFQIDPLSLQSAVIASEQQLAVAQASLEVAKASLGKSEAEATKAARDFERFQRLHKDGRVTDNEFEIHHLQYEQAKVGLAVSKAQVGLAESHVLQAAAALEISRKSLTDTKSVAPISGAVTMRHKEPGEQVGIGEIVMRIEDPSSIEAVAYLPAAYYTEVLPGKTPARLTIAGKEAGSFIVTYRSPVINTTLRTFEIKGKVESKEAVAGAMADITLVFESRKAIGIPSNALLQRNGKPSVFIARDGKSLLKNLETGLINEGWTEVASGLEADDLVIIEGQTQLREGMAVTILK
jgi:RND family efflux transporter MFP subunit